MMSPLIRLPCRCSTRHPIGNSLRKSGSEELELELELEVAGLCVGGQGLGVCGGVGVATGGLVMALGLAGLRLRDARLAGDCLLEDLGELVGDVLECLEVVVGEVGL